MSDVVTVVQNDSNPRLYFQLTDKSDDSTINVAGDTVVSAKFRLKNADVSLFETTCIKIRPSIGFCRIDWPTGALDVDAGRYQFEVTVTWSTGIQTVLDYIEVKVKAEFGDVS